MLVNHFQKVGPVPPNKLTHQPLSSFQTLAQLRSSNRHMVFNYDAGPPPPRPAPLLHLNPAHKTSSVIWLALWWWSLSRCTWSRSREQWMNCRYWTSLVNHKRDIILEQRLDYEVVEFLFHLRHKTENEDFTHQHTFWNTMLLKKGLNKKCYIKIFPIFELQQRK